MVAWQSPKLFVKVRVFALVQNIMLKNRKMKGVTQQTMPCKANAGIQKYFVIKLPVRGRGYMTWNNNNGED